MEPAQIYIDGRIDLISQVAEPKETVEQLEGMRASRLNDVMIVLERKQAAFEDALAARLKAGAVAGGLDGLALRLDDQAPRFTVAIQPTEPETALDLTRDQRAALANEISSELVAIIEQHAAYSEQPRWKPSVEAVFRASEAETASERRMKSIWLRTLFWLLAAVILGVAYLYLKRGHI